MPKNSPDLSAGDRAALGERIREVVEKIGSRNLAAEIAGVTTQQLRNLIAGKSAPSLLVMARLAERAKVSLDYVAFGQMGPSPGEVLVEVARYAPKTRLKALLAEGLAGQLERIYRVKALSEELDDAVGELVEAIVVASDASEPRARQLIERVVALVRAKR